LKEELRLEELSQKESKLIAVLDFAQIEKNITVVSITNTPKDREEIASKKGEAREPIKPKILQQQKELQSVEKKLSLVSTNCGVGVKQNSKGNRKVWIGGKLYISVVDGDIPITAFYSGANVHDSSVALPLMQETSNRVNYLYDLQDAGYDADIIRDFSTKPSNI